jgi:hypothetical protein
MSIGYVPSEVLGIVVGFIVYTTVQVSEVPLRAYILYLPGALSNKPGRGVNCDDVILKHTGEVNVSQSPLYTLSRVEVKAVL